MLKIGIVAGEPSGDHLGADLIRLMKKTCPDLELAGIGGPELIGEGCYSLYPMEKLSVMGIVEILKHLPELLRIRAGLKRYFLANPPDIFIGIDSPDFNLPLEKFLRANGTRTVHYVSPTVWAWREGRLKTIARAVDLMLTVFPFEKQYYDNRNIQAMYVGHPLARSIPLVNDLHQARQSLGIDTQSRFIAILPGSRAGEIKRITPAFLQACTMCREQIPQLRFIAGLLKPEHERMVLEIRDRTHPDLQFETFVNRTRTVIAAADVVLVTSGTATFETMLVNRPMVVGYRANWLSVWIVRKMVKVKFAALPNLLANDELVPELLQEHCEPARLSRALMHWLQDQQACQQLEQRFTKLHKELLHSANDEVVQRITALIEDNAV